MPSASTPRESRPTRDTRSQMVESAAAMFRERGYDGTGLRQVVEHAGAARGAIYHHFPGGKEQIAIEVVDRFGGWLVRTVEEVCATSSPEDAVRSLMGWVEKVLVNDATPGRSGCPIAAVALAAEDDDGTLRAAAHEVFAGTRRAIASCLRRDGVSHAAADNFATMAVAAAEGVVILARAAQDPGAVTSVRASLLWTLGQLPRA